MKKYRRSRSIARQRPLLPPPPQEKIPVTIQYEVKWTPESGRKSWKREKNPLSLPRIEDNLAHKYMLSMLYSYDICVKLTVT
jgi:hypothetical protein